MLCPSREALKYEHNGGEQNGQIVCYYETSETERLGIVWHVWRTEKTRYVERNIEIKSLGRLTYKNHKGWRKP